MKFKVQFFKGTKAQYNLISPDRYTFYFCTDTQQVYLGDTQLTNTDFNFFQNQINQINQSIEDISQDIIQINQEIDGYEENAVDILTVSEENKVQIESEISKKNRFYLYVYEDEYESPNLKLGDGIKYIADLPFLCQSSSGGSSGGEGLPSGGSAGQVLTKNSSTNYDVKWQTIRVNSNTYVYEQGIASDNWTITHNLDKYPSVTVVDTAGSVVIGEIQYTNRNLLIIKFAAPFKGSAYLN